MSYIKAIGSKPLLFYTSALERMKIDSSGRIGINMTPSYKLDITVSSGDGIRVLQNSVSSSLGVNISDIPYVGSLSNSPFAFFIWGAEKARFDTSGNLGIGGAPSTLLDIIAAQPTLTITETQHAGQANLSFRSNVNGRLAGDMWQIQAIITAGGNNGSEYEVGDLVFKSRSTVASGTVTEKMRMDAAGNMGIGTTTLNTRLAVGDSTSTTNTTIMSRSDSGNWLLTSQGSGDAATNAGISRGHKAVATGAYPIVISHNTTQPIIFGTNDTERMRIDINGNVGIGHTPRVMFGVGTTAGSWAGATTGIKSEISGPNATIQGGGNLRVLGTTAQGTGLGGSIVLGGMYSTTAAIDFGAVVGQKENATDSNTAGYLAFGTRGSVGNLDERMRIDSTGKVGIGTAPSVALDVLTAIGTAAQLNLTSGNNTTTSQVKYGQTGAIAWTTGITTTTGDFKIAIEGGGTALDIVRSGTSISYQSFLTNGFERMRINSNGRIALGTGTVRSNPLCDLYVEGATQATGAVADAGNMGGTLLLTDNTVSGGLGGTILFGAVANKFFAAIKSGLTSGSGNTAGSLQFSTRNADTDSALTTRFTIGSTGAITINGFAGGGSTTATIDNNGSIIRTSDSKLKQEIIEAPLPGLNEILQIQPKAYKWLNDIEQNGANAKMEIGFFADQVHPIIPSAAPQDKEGLYGFYDRAMIAALVKSVQELKAQLDAYKNSN